MKEILSKKLEELNKQKAMHSQSLNELTSARERCIATLNGTLGAIEIINDLLKDINKKEAKPDEKK